MDNGLSGFFAGIAAFGASILPGATPDKPAAVQPQEKPAIVEEKPAAAPSTTVALPVEMRLLPPRRPADVVAAAPSPAPAAPEPARSAKAPAAPEPATPAKAAAAPEPAPPLPAAAAPVLPAAAAPVLPAAAAPVLPAAAPELRPRPRTVVAVAPSAAPVAPLSAPPLPPSFHRIPPGPAIAAAPPAPPVVTASALPGAPIPAGEPRRAAEAPARPAPDVPRIAPSLPGPMHLAAAPSTAPTPRAQPLGDQEIVERANAFFNNLTTLVADFTQIGGDGRRLSGTLYLQRPGKVRFAYDKPATLEVIADGSSVAVQDTKLATQDLYPISQTPLKFLLRERVNLGQDVRVTGVSHEGDSVRLSLEDRSTLGGTSKITLFFDPQVENLTQWRIVDPQGFQTTLMLNKVDRNRRIDQKHFVINIDTSIKTDNGNR